MGRTQSQVAKVVSLERVLHSRPGESSGVSGLPGKLPVPGNNRVDLINIAEILYCKASSNYTEVYLAGGRKVMLSKTLKWTCMTLRIDPFFRRIHQSYLVNMRYVTALIKTDSWYLEVNGQLQLPVSRSSRTLVNRILGITHH